MDNWEGRALFSACKRCMYYVEKKPMKTDRTYTVVGRCRRRSPVVEIGYPVVYPTDFCGEFKLDENKV